MHNMMVAYHMEHSEEEHAKMYMLDNDKAEMILNRIVKADRAEQEVLWRMW